MKKIITKTEQIHLKPTSILRYATHISKNLYNEANYIIRQEFFKTGRWVRYYELIDILKGTSENYRILPINTSQQILRHVDMNWKSFFNLSKEYKTNSNKFKGKPRPPRYKKKNGENLLIFTNQQVRIRNNKINLLRKLNKMEVKTRLPDDTKIRHIRIIPKGTHYVCEIVYKQEINPPERDKSRIIGIDLGVNNLATIVNNIGEQPIIIKGGIIKSTNQYYNKESGKLKSTYALQQKTSKPVYGNKLNKLINKRNNKINDFFHKTSYNIIKYCTDHNIGVIVIGKNKEWKQNVNMGKINNQNFISLSFNKLINKIQYKAEEQGIEVILQEESYTSKCSFLNNEPVQKHITYKGKRIKRGLFKTNNGTLINADVNGAYNILKKAIPNAFSNGIEGVALHPISYQITNKCFSKV